MKKPKKLLFIVVILIFLQIITVDSSENIVMSRALEVETGINKEYNLNNLDMKHHQKMMNNKITKKALPKMMIRMNKSQMSIKKRRKAIKKLKKRSKNKNKLLFFL